MGLGLPLGQMIWRILQVDVGEILGYAYQLLNDMGMMPFLTAFMIVTVAFAIVRMVFKNR